MWSKGSGTGSVQAQKLTFEQKRIKQWRARRNHLVCELLANDKNMLRADALKEANRIMNQKKKVKHEEG